MLGGGGGIYQSHREIETQSVEMSAPWEEDEEMSRCEDCVRLLIKNKDWWERW